MTEQDASDPAGAAADETGATADATEFDGEADDGAGDPVSPDEVIDPDEADADVGDGADAADGEGNFEAVADQDLIDRVAESDPESVAHELAALRTRVDGLEEQLDAREEELDDLTEKLKRKQAEFQNYKKRMEQRREEEKQRATEDLVSRLLDVRDNLQRALEQDEDVDIRGGVESTLRSFDDVLDQENVAVVEPEPGEDVDPHRHEVLVRVESDQPEGSIAEVHRPGYVMADKVIREAQVTVSDGSGGEE
ncbi:nucleotide exchange factor GrpE [Halosimplex amylolyticum]|uniref:nucleotide exchange factor GrpE n=1 Tax=Halosimplex amylolyticum TaxID=3396616 RepID=UPI003F578431